MKKFLIVSLLISSLSIPAFTQQPQESAPTYMAKGEIVIDGLLEEDDWNSAPPANLLLQPHPDRQEAVRTETKILYNDNFIYLGFLCYEPQPESILAEVTQRDADLRYDDSVYVLVDASSLLETMFVFVTNPAGTRTDAAVSRDGQQLDAGWNGNWDAAVKATDFGWSVEMVIDLRELGVTPTVGTSIPLLLSRVVPRLDSSFWSEPLDPAFQLSSMGVMHRLSFQSELKRAEVSAHILTGYEATEDALGGVGLDASYMFSQQISTHILLNPEFETVEDDEEFFNLTRYEPYLPEKREYFKSQEQAFESRLPIFYSKRIGDIYGSAEIKFRSDSFDLTAMSAQTRPDDTAFQDQTANFSVFSLRKFIGQGTSVRVMSANMLVDGNSTGAAAVDANLSLYRSLVMEGMFAYSYGPYAEDNLAYYVGPRLDTENFHFHAFFQKVDPRFGDNVNPVGYIFDDNRRELDSALIKSFTIEKSGVDKINYISNYNIYWGVDDTLRSWRVGQGLKIDTTNNFFIGMNHSREFKLFDVEYRNSMTDIFFGWDSKQWQMFSLKVGLGRNYGRRIRTFEIDKRLYVSQKMTLEYRFNSINYPIIGGNRTQKSFFIHRIRSTYTFQDNWQFKIFAQWHNTPKPSKYNIQSWVIYIFRPPMGSLSICYQLGDGPFGLSSSQESTFLFKINYGF